MRRFLPVLLACHLGCTTLGPVPAVTGSSYRVEGRSDATAQLGVVPGWYLSEATQEKPDLTSMGQAALWFDPGELLPEVEGVGLGGRLGGEGRGYAEPLLRYRTEATEGLGLGLVLGGTYARDRERLAHYEAWRGTLELGGDLRLSPPSEWAEVHVQLVLGAQALDARGAYCVGLDGYGTDCPLDGTATLIDGKLRGVYPSAGGALALDFARGLRSPFHGGRLALWGAAGVMPRIVQGAQEGSRASTSAGITLELSFGGRERTRP